MLGKRIFKVVALGLALGTASAAQAGSVEWNGFGSLYYGQALEPELLAPLLTDSKADFSSLSLMGLNVGGKVNEKTSVAAQLVAASQTASGTWGMSANWAYLGYKPVDSVNIKLGRQLLPVFIASEYDKVGQLLPTRRIPGATTFSPFSGFDGVSVDYTFGIADAITMTVSGFGGRPNYELTAVTKALGYVGSAEELLGATAQVDGNGWRVRTAFNRSRALVSQTVSGVTTPREALLDQFSVGGRYDRGGIVFWTEYMNRHAVDGTQVTPTTPGTGGMFLQSLRGGYAMLGYRLGDFLPRYTFTRSDAQIGTASGGYDGHSFGFNYAITPTATFKFDYEMYTTPNPAVAGNWAMTRKAGSTKTDSSAVFAGVDFIF